MAACAALSAASIAAAPKAAVALSRNEIAIDMAQSKKQRNQKNGTHNIICHAIPSKKIKKSETHQTANLIDQKGYQPCHGKHVDCGESHPLPATGLLLDGAKSRHAGRVEL